MPRQLLRLFESRKSGSFDDQQTPAQIAASEAAAADHEEFLDAVLSQIRQILGTANWWDPVPTTLTAVASVVPTVIEANCLAGDAPGDCVRMTGPEVAGKAQVTRVSIDAYATVPAWGVILSKSASTDCLVQWLGPLRGVYTGLTAGRVYFVGVDGRPTLTPPVPTTVDLYLQRVGVALSTDALLLTPDYTLVKLRA